MGEAFLSSALVFSRLGEIERLVVEEVVLLPLGHLHQGADGRPGDGRAPESKRGHRRLGVGVVPPDRQSQVFGVGLIHRRH